VTANFRFKRALEQDSWMRRQMKKTILSLSPYSDRTLILPPLQMLKNVKKRSSLSNTFVTEKTIILRDRERLNTILAVIKKLSPKKQRMGYLHFGKDHNLKT